MAKRRRTNRSEEEWFRLVSEQGRSGQTQEGYCREVGISPTSFQRWRQRLERKGAGKFIEVQSESRPAAKVELEVPGGVTLRIWS